MMKTALSFLALLLIAGSAAAGPMLRLSDGASTVTISDGGVGDSGALAGVVVYNGAIGTDFIVNVTTGLTKPLIGTSTWPRMDLNSVNVSSLNGGTLTIEFTDTDFIGPGSVTGFITQIGGTTNGTVSLRSYYDASNTAFGTGTLLSDLGPFASSPYAAIDSTPQIPGANYSLTMVATITHGGRSVQTTSFDAELSPVPEPGTLALVGAAGIAFALIRRRRKNAA